MHTILDEIVSNKRIEVERLKALREISSFTTEPLFQRTALSLKKAVTKTEMGIIAEIKRKSPSGGDILPGLDPASVAAEYEKAGVAGISILTDFNYFGGSIDDIRNVRDQVNVPILRKEFIIDEIQLFEAKAAGADAVLLIAAILSQSKAHQLTIIAQSLGMEVLFEVHTPDELEKINPDVDLIAVNNRDLKAQLTSLDHSFRLGPILPGLAPAISASGISTPEELIRLKAAGFSGALIGESVLRNGTISRLTNLQTI